MRKIVVLVIAFVGASMLPSAGCGGGDEDDAPPPPRTASAPQVASAQGVGQPGQPTAPTGQVMVTVVADSNPRGAIVTGGGRQLGVTPLRTQVPVPAPAPGQVQTFAFTFQLANYQPATINASPVNNTISITAALAPAVQPQEVAATANGGGDEGGASELRVSGHGGGAIYDHHTTTATAVVDQRCTIDRLRVRLNGHHTYLGDLYVTLRDPNGNRYSLKRGGNSNPFRSHNVSRAAGRQAQGRWTLSIEDRLAQDRGMLRGWSMHLRCR